MNLPERVFGERLAEMTDERLRMVIHELSFLERERLDDAGDRAVSAVAEFVRREGFDAAAFGTALDAASMASEDWQAAMAEYARRQGSR